MARTRALLTETEREYFRTDEGDSKHYQAVSRVRNRIKDELKTDVHVLREHHPELYEEMTRIVCENEE